MWERVGVVAGFGAEVDLGVIGIAVEVQVEAAEYLTEGEDVGDEEEGTEYGALGNALCDCGCGRDLGSARNSTLEVGVSRY
ncbi:putative splicing factor arginine/serine-rich 7 [Scophthalmus maximus]|uniref:Putative splicing factor arginine/serine-rich 7 n=1 Tax=Scophthalmus maximus TaxID=52904 RepID=A0A2U9BY64_SCOMX|nr:putative splicing factor arginine/serine-rich 7 [Scophthalmus maximus]